MHIPSKRSWGTLPCKAGAKKKKKEKKRKKAPVISFSISTVLGLV
jgi:hypothetical protein